MQCGTILRYERGQAADIDTTTAGGELVLGMFAALAEFERELIREGTRARDSQPALGVDQR